MGSRRFGKTTRKNLIISIGIIIFFVVIIFFYYQRLFVATRDNLIKDGELTASRSANIIDNYMTTNSDLVKFSAYSLDAMLRENRSDEEIQEFLVTQSTAIKAAVFEDTTGLYACIRGKFFSGTNWVPPADYEVTSRPWYIKPMKYPGKLTILEPYHDIQSGHTMLALGRSLCDGESVVSLDLSLEQIQRLTEEAVADSGGKNIEMVLTDDGTVVTHSDPSEVGKNYTVDTDSVGALVFKKMRESGERVISFKVENTHYIVYDAVFQGEWHCVSVQDATTSYHWLYHIFFVTVLVVIVIIFIISIIMARSTRRALIAEAAVASNEAKSSFLSSMSHEIRTPINAVIGMNEMILRESSDEKIIGYAENVKAAGDTLLSIVNDILDFSKIEAGKLEITPAEYDLSSVLNDMVNMVKNRMDEKGLTFVTEFDRNLPSRLYGDDVRIRQIMANILTNAAKYTEKGTVTFRVGFTKAEGLEDTIKLRVSVKDTGTGIRKEDMEKLFSKFERLDIGKTRTIEGSGLGMSITRSLLQMMGSDIEVESTFGSGSTFSFAIDQIVVSWAPIGEYDSESLNASRKKPFAERFRAPDAKVLVVDDNPLNIKVFTNLLKHTEMQVDTAEGGVAALSLIYKNTYDLILLDHMMPEKDGVEVLHEFRARTDHPNVETPVICLTANAVAGAREEYLSEGFDDYLSKPVNADLLEEMILKYLPPEKIFAFEEKQEEESPVPEKILALKDGGIDVETGISNSGTLEDYLSLLKIFYITMKDKAGEIDGYYRQEDYKNYTILVHALKSSARIIGALDLGEEAQRLELAGKAGDVEVIRHYHDRFMTHYRGYGEALKDLFESDEDGADKPQADPERIKRALENVLQAASEMDCIALDSIFEEMSAYSMPAEQSELWKKLKEASDHFDYEGIEKLLG